MENGDLKYDVYWIKRRKFPIPHPVLKYTVFFTGKPLSKLNIESLNSACFHAALQNLLSQWQVNHSEKVFSGSGIKWAKIPIDPEKKKMFSFQENKETVTSNDVIYILQ